MRFYFAIWLALLTLAGVARAAPGPNITNLVGVPSGVVVLSGVPSSLAANATFTSACVQADKYRALDVFAATAGVATLQVQRYADPACTYPAGAALPPTALTLATGTNCPGVTYCGDVGANDGLPFLAYIIKLHDTSSATNAVTTVTLVQGGE